MEDKSFMRDVMNSLVPSAGAATVLGGKGAGAMLDDQATTPVSNVQASGLPAPRASPFAGITDAALQAAAKAKGPSSPEYKEVMRRVNEPAR